MKAGDVATNQFNNEPIFKASRGLAWSGLRLRTEKLLLLLDNTEMWVIARKSDHIFLAIIEVFEKVYFSYRSDEKS